VGTERRTVKHLTPARLADLDELLAELRTIEGITERRPGIFYRRSRAFLHFHEDGADLYADARLTGDDFDRRRVTTKAEQQRLVREVRTTLTSGES
jgi:hypothetical protein